MAGVWMGLAVVAGAVAVVAWLKGALGVALVMMRRFVHEFGESWTVATAAEPLLPIIAVVATGAFGLARPGSRWAHWFYHGAKMVRAQERYAEDGVVAAERR